MLPRVDDGELDMEKRIGPSASQIIRRNQSLATTDRVYQYKSPTMLNDRQMDLRASTIEEAKSEVCELSGYESEGILPMRGCDWNAQFDFRDIRKARCSRTLRVVQQ